MMQRLVSGGGLQPRSAVQGGALVLGQEASLRFIERRRRRLAAEVATSPGGVAVTRTLGPKRSVLDQAHSNPVLSRTAKEAGERHRDAQPHPLPALPRSFSSSLSEYWPSEVLALLSAIPRGKPSDALAVQPANEGLRLKCGVAQIPHPRKAKLGGEDSFFLCSHGSAAGVADGVGEWGWRFRINPRAFADEIMLGAQRTADSTLEDASFSARKRVSAMLRGGYDAARCFGSATALVVALDARGKELGIANLGDSGLRQLRFDHASRAGGGPKIVHKTREQQHMFNCPFQLTRLPQPEDFDSVLAEGKTALIQAVKSNRFAHQDGPDDADLYSCRLREGDLLLLGTDGLFDNIHDQELCELLSQVVSPLEVGGPCGSDPKEFTDPNIIASAIAMAAFHRSKDRSARTPFTLHAKDAGLYHVGGKMDDITVVAAWAVRRSGSPCS